MLPGLTELRHGWHRALGISIVCLLTSQSVSAQSANAQLWGNVTLEWIKSHALTFGLQVEPKLLVSKPDDDPGWATIELIPSVEYSHGNWLDVVGDLVVARTRQTDDLRTTEIAPRLGFRFHILSNLRDAIRKEKQPKRRIVLRNLFRIEWRNLDYSDDTPDSSTVRVRDRVELLVPLNRPRITDDGASYVTSDAEWFWTHHDQAERFANKERVRIGLGHRYSFAWRAEALYVWDRSRDSADDGFTTADHALYVRIRRVW
jgi:hypothetical protein